MFKYALSSSNDFELPPPNEDKCWWSPVCTNVEYLFIDNKR